MTDYIECPDCEGTGKIHEGHGCGRCGHTGHVKRRGRPKLDITDDERARRKRISTAKSNAKSKNVTLDSDLVGALNAVADELAPIFGFRPTISQSLRHLIARRKA